MLRPLSAFAWVITAFFILLEAAAGTAQTSKVGATLAGTISDSSGAVIPGVEIRLRNTSTNQTRSVMTDEQGFFRAQELLVGTYEVRVDRAGFAPYLHTGVTLSVGQTLHLDIVLVPAAAAAQVTVSDQPPAIDPSQTSVTSMVDKERIEELPVRSRNSLDFILLSPGVSSSAQQSPSGGPKPVADSGFSFAGLRARSNSISIDGLDNNDEYTGASRTELSPEIVLEFRVVNNGLSAESGGASGGSINVVTRTGTNTIHGDAFVFIQDAALNARDPFENEAGKPDFRRYRAGFSIGGPLVKDRTFYYTAFEQEHNRAQKGSEIEPAVALAINSFLGGGMFPRLATRQITAALFPIARAETEASGKLNHQLSARHSLMLRYAFTNDREAGDAFGTGGLTDPSARGSSFIADNALVGSFTSVLGSQAVGDLRFQVATRRAILRTNDMSGPEIDIAGLVQFGRSYEGNSFRRENHYQLSYTFTRTKGHHLWKAGTTVNRVRLRARVPDGFGGVYLFGSLSDFLAGRADSFRQAFGGPDTDFAVTSYGAFVQDHWSVTPKMTLDIGARYDFEHLPNDFNEDTNNFSPRVGLAFSPSRKWVLRAGFGIFFDRYVLANLNRAIGKNGQRAFEQVAHGDAAAGIFRMAAGGSVKAPLATIAPSIFRTDARLATPYSQQTSLGAEYLVAHDLIATVNYLFVRGVKLSRTRNTNLLPPVVLTPQNAASLGVPNLTPQQLGRPVFGPGRSDPLFDGIYQIEDSTSSAYKGLTVSLNRRMANELEFSANYTLSKTFDDASDFDEQPENPFNLRVERSLSRQHQQQRFVFNALWELPIGEEETKGSNPSGSSGVLTRAFSHIEMGAILTVGSGRPVNPLTGLDSNRGHAFPLSVRPLGFGRNSLKTRGLVTMDFRVVKYFRFGESAHLDLVGEFFNLFNRANVTQINPLFGSDLAPLAGFARPLEGRGARQIQFSIDFEF